VYLVMLELRPPHSPLSLVTATVTVFGGSTAAVRKAEGGGRVNAIQAICVSGCAAWGAR
jgi:hypothetical protein